MKRIIPTLAILACFVFATLAAGTVTRPTKDNDNIREYFSPGRGKFIRIITWPWSITAGQTSTSGGTVYDQTGKILNIWGNSWNDTADDNYDVTILNEFDMDVLHSDGLNMPQDDSDETCRITPVGDNGAHRYLFGDDLRFSGKNLGTASDASGEFHMMIEVWE